MKSKQERIREALKGLEHHGGFKDRIKKEIGLESGDRLDELLKLIGAGGGRGSETEKLSACLAELSSCPDVDMAVLNLYKFIKASTHRYLTTSFCFEKPVFEVLLKIFSASNYFSNMLISNPGLALWLVEEKTLFQNKSYSSYVKGLRAQIAPLRDTRRIMNSIKSYKARETLRIATRDLMGIAGIDGVTAELSYLADAVIRIVSEVSFKEAASTSGLRDMEWEQKNLSPYSNFAIISLGKLGGHELNYSSDIDLLFITGEPYDEKERTFYIELAKRITENLSAVTEKGMLYRVDLRLRPDGESGPLVISLSNHLNYMINRAHHWEKQALLKARGSAGNETVIDSFIQNCTRVIFDPLDRVAALAQIAAMREKSIGSLSTSERTRNIKEMPGGIRDTEFIVQALQLIHGREKPEILSRNTLESIERLKNAGLLKEETATALERAYVLYRTIEHRLQIVNNRRTHTIPGEEEEIKKLSKRTAMSDLGESIAGNFTSELATHIKLVESIFNHFFKNQSPDIVYFLSLKPSRARDTLRRVNPVYTEELSEKILPFLKSIVFGDFPDLAPAQTRQSARKALPILLKDLAETPDPALAMKNLHLIIKATGAVKSMLDVTTADSEMRRMLIKIASTSSVISGILSKHIEWLDSFIEGYAFEISKSRNTTELKNAFTQNLVLTIINNPIPERTQEETGRVLSTLIEKTVSRLFEILGGGSTSLAFFAVGSLGTYDCRFGSDIDLVAVSSRDVPDGKEFDFVKRFLTEAREAGLHRIDLRLRPEGSGSPTVNTLGRFRKYLKNRASPWEVISYTRARFICGDEETGTAFKEVLGTVMEETDIDDEFVSQLLQVRAKLESLSKNEWNVKHIAGGSYDIEFIVSLLFLLSGKGHTRGENTTVTLNSFLETPELLSRSGLTAEDIQTLVNHYRLYYLIVHGASLHGFPLPPPSTRGKYYSDYFHKLLSPIYEPGKPFNEFLQETENKTREIFKRVFRT